MNSRWWSPGLHLWLYVSVDFFLVNVEVLLSTSGCKFLLRVCVCVFLGGGGVSSLSLVGEF